MKKVKSDWRSSLDTDTMTSLMRINLQSPDEDAFDPMPAIMIWNNLSKRKRRPFQPPYKKVLSKESDGDSDPTDHSDSDSDSQQSQ